MNCIRPSSTSSEWSTIHVETITSLLQDMKYEMMGLKHEIQDQTNKIYKLEEMVVECGGKQDRILGNQTNIVMDIRAIRLDHTQHKDNINNINNNMAHIHVLLTSLCGENTLNGSEEQDEPSHVDDIDDNDHELSRDNGDESVTGSEYNELDMSDMDRQIKTEMDIGEEVEFQGLESGAPTATATVKVTGLNMCRYIGANVVTSGTWVPTPSGPVPSNNIHASAALAFRKRNLANFGPSPSGEKMSSPGGNGGYRTVYPESVTEILEQSFRERPYYTMETKKVLAQKTGLDERKVKVWFQNRRSKELRLKKRCQYLIDDNNKSSQ